MEYLNVKILNASSDEAIIVARLNGEIVTCNKKALDMFGYSSIQDFKQYTLRDTMPEDFSRLFPLQLTPEHLNINSYEMHISRQKDGQLFPVKIHSHYQEFAG